MSATRQLRAMPILGNLCALWAVAGRCGAMHFHCETRLISILGTEENGILWFTVDIREAFNKKNHFLIDIRQ